MINLNMVYLSQFGIHKINYNVLTFWYVSHTFKLGKIDPIRKERFEWHELYPTQNSKLVRNRTYPNQTDPTRYCHHSNDDLNSKTFEISNTRVTPDQNKPDLNRPDNQSMAIQFLSDPKLTRRESEPNYHDWEAITQNWHTYQIGFMND